MRTGPVGRAARVLRGSAAASATTLVSLLAHVAAGGIVPSPLLVAVVVVVAVPVGIVAVGRRGSAAGHVVTALAAQGAFHAVFSLAGPAALHAGAGHAGHDGMLVAETSGSGHGAMTAAHLAAAVTTALLLAAGDRALRVVRDLVFAVARRLRALPARPPVGAHRATPALLRRIAAPRAPLARRIPARRGPPAAAVAR